MRAHARYSQVQVKTSSPGDLLLALYDGIFRFVDAAIGQFEGGEKVQGMELCSKAHAIVSELQIALDHEVAPDLCQNLSNLYDFSLQRLTYAQRHCDPVALRDVKRTLSPLREGFRMAVPRAAAERAAKSAAAARPLARAAAG